MKKNAVPVLFAAALPLLGIAVPAALLAAAPRAARADAPDPLAGGRVLPASDKSVAGYARLLAAVAADLGLTGGLKGDASVAVWAGDAYKPGRADFRRSALRTALKSAGYTVEDKERTDVNVNPFQDQYGLSLTPDGPAPGSVSFTPSDRTFYFKAVNPKTGDAIVGSWTDQPTENKLLLGYAHVAGYKAEAAPGALPGLPAGAFLVQDLDDVMKGAPAPSLPTFPKLAKKPRFVRGVVEDGAGKPIANAKFVVWASAAGGFRTEVKGVSDAQGRYEIPLPVGVCQVVNADCRVTYGGREYVLPLHPADGERENFNSAEGAVENFVLRSWGKTTEGGGAYGGTVRVLEWVPETGDAAKDGVIEVTLTPDGPQLDGATGRTMVVRFANGHSTEKFLRNVPIGRYTMTAALLDGGERLPLRIKPVYGEGEYADTYPVVFEGENGALASLTHSGVKQIDVTLQP